MKYLKIHKVKTYFAEHAAIWYIETYGVYIKDTLVEGISYN